MSFVLEINWRIQVIATIELLVLIVGSLKKQYMRWLRRVIAAYTAYKPSTNETTEDKFERNSHYSEVFGSRTFCRGDHEGDYNRRF